MDSYANDGQRRSGFVRDLYTLCQQVYKAERTVIQVQFSKSNSNRLRLEIKSEEDRFRIWGDGLEVT